MNIHLYYDENLTFPFPHRTRVPINAIFFLEVCPFDFKTGAVILAEGSVSPVKLLSSIAKSIAYNIKISHSIKIYLNG